MSSVLAQSTPEQVEAAPFAHLVADPALSSELYSELAAGFPPPDHFLQGGVRTGSNQAVRIPATRVIDDEHFCPAWREFFDYHTSPAFWADIVRVFGAEIRAAHPSLEHRLGRPLEEFRVVRKGEGGLADITLDALFVINTPVTAPSSVRPPHVDAATKIFSGLLYMRAPDDDSSGGDLDLYAPRAGGLRFGGHYVPEAMLERQRHIEYGPNRFVGFVNSARSVHGVSPRNPTARVRRYVNFVAETSAGNFSLPRLPWYAQARFWLERRRSKRPGITLAR